MPSITPPRYDQPRFDPLGAGRYQHDHNPLEAVCTATDEVHGIWPCEVCAACRDAIERAEAVAR